MKLPAAALWNSSGTRGYPDISALFGKTVPYCIVSASKYTAIDGADILFHSLYVPFFRHLFSYPSLVFVYHRFLIYLPFLLTRRYSVCTGRTP